MIRTPDRTIKYILTETIRPVGVAKKVNEEHEQPPKRNKFDVLIIIDMYKMNEDCVIQFFTSFLNKVISKSLKIMELLIISSSLLALLNRIKTGIALRSQEYQAS